MRMVRSMGLITLVTLFSAAVLVLLLHGIPSVFAQTGTPPSSSISSSSGPVSWDFGPVGGGTVTNVGIQDVCPPGMCELRIATSDGLFTDLKPACRFHVTECSRKYLVSC